MKEITYDGDNACIDGVRLDNTFMYVSDGTWYVKGSICWLEANCGRAGGLFVGVHRIEDEIDAKNRRSKIGDEGLDGELCSWGEFDIYDKDRTLVKKADPE